VSSPLFPDSPTVLRAREAARAQLAAAAEASEDTVVDFSQRLLRTFLGLCENPRTRQGMLRMVRSSVGSARAGRAFYRVLNRTVVNPAARATGVQPSAGRLGRVWGQRDGRAR
jgi:hypothetical protein